MSDRRSDGIGATDADQFHQFLKLFIISHASCAELTNRGIGGSQQDFHQVKGAQEMPGTGGFRSISAWKAQIAGKKGAKKKPYQ